MATSYRYMVSRVLGASVLDQVGNNRVLPPSVFVVIEHQNFLRQVTYQLAFESPITINLDSFSRNSVILFSKYRLDRVHSSLTTQTHIMQIFI